MAPSPAANPASGAALPLGLKGLALSWYPEIDPQHVVGLKNASFVDHR